VRTEKYMAREQSKRVHSKREGARHKERFKKWRMDGLFWYKGHTYCRGEAIPTLHI